MLGQLLVQLAFTGKLEHQKNALLVVKVAVQAQDVGVSQVGLDLDLAPQLLFGLGFDELGLVEALEGEDVARFGLCSDHVDPTELAFA